jgi:hypothetical protein
MAMIERKGVPMKSIQMKPYGVLHSQGKKYFLLNPQPVPRDSCWNDDVYTFFVATWDGLHISTHIIVRGDFLIELDRKMPSIDVMDVYVGEEVVPAVEEELLTWDEYFDRETAVLDDQEPLRDEFIDIEDEGE